MNKKIIIIATIIVSLTCAIAFAKMGMEMSMGMSPGSGSGGGFPSAPANSLKGSDGNYILDSTGGYIGVYAP